MNASMKRVLSAIAILAVGGMIVSFVSLQHHYATSKTAYCDIGTAFNCDIVNRSDYSSIMGVPVALIGLLGYGAVLGLATVYRERRETPSWIFAGAAAGLVFALYLAYVEARVLGVWCILCLSSLALISSITVVSGVLWSLSRRDDL
jgi:uncharacterized membrane protein